MSARDRIFWARQVGVDSDDDWRELHEIDPEEAAVDFAQKRFAEQEPFSSIDVDVRDSVGNVSTWTVTVEAIPHFSAARKV